MDLKALFEISYGLYLVTAQENGKDNGCIINTFSQQTVSHTEVPTWKLYSPFSSTYAEG